MTFILSCLAGVGIVAFIIVHDHIDYLHQRIDELEKKVAAIGAKEAK